MKRAAASRPALVWGPNMRRGRPAVGIDDLSADCISRLNRVLNGNWELPIVFERDGDVLTGRLDMAASADLRTFSRNAAERDIAMVFKQAILARTGVFGG